MPTPRSPPCTARLACRGQAGRRNPASAFLRSHPNKARLVQLPFHLHSTISTISTISTNRRSVKMRRGALSEPWRPSNVQDVGASIPGVRVTSRPQEEAPTAMVRPHLPRAQGSHSTRVSGEGLHVFGGSRGVAMSVSIGPGNRGNGVGQIQRRLADLGYLTALDGGEHPDEAVFDADTERAVAQFQTDRQLPATGIVDDATWALLMAPSSKPIPRQPSGAPRSGSGRPIPPPPGGPPRSVRGKPIPRQPSGAPRVGSGRPIPPPPDPSPAAEPPAAGAKPDSEPLPAPIPAVAPRPGGPESPRRTGWGEDQHSDGSPASDAGLEKELVFREGVSRARRGRRRVVVGAGASAGSAIATDPISSAVSTALEDVVKPGRIAFNPPPSMKLRETVRVEVGLVGSENLDSQLKEKLQDRNIQIESIDTSPYMSVSLSGTAFLIEPLGNYAEQLVTSGSVAMWQFDVTAKKHGVQRLTLAVSLLIPIPGHSNGFHNVPVFEREIKVTVERGQLFADWFRSQWKWLVASFIAVAGAVGTWLGIFHH